MIPAGMLGANPVLRELPIAEEQRQRMRSSVLRQLAEIEFFKHRRAEIETAIRAVDSDLEEITARHVAECRPKQERLREIQNLQIAEIAARKSKSKSLEDERLHLQDEVDRANATLSEAVRRADDRRKPLQDELNAWPQSPNEQVLYNELVKYGKPEALDQLFIAQIARWWADRRLESSLKIRDALEHKRDEAKRNGRPLEVVQSHAEAVRKFGVETTAASQAYRAAVDECDRLRHELIAE